MLVLCSFLNDSLSWCPTEGWGLNSEPISFLIPQLCNLQWFCFVLLKPDKNLNHHFLLKLCLAFGPHNPQFNQDTSNTNHMADYQSHSHRYPNRQIHLSILRRNSNISGKNRDLRNISDLNWSNRHKNELSETSEASRTSHFNLVGLISSKCKRVLIIIIINIIINVRAWDPTGKGFPVQIMVMYFKKKLETKAITNENKLKF